jgi:hypothetical protein
MHNQMQKVKYMMQDLIEGCAIGACLVQRKESLSQCDLASVVSQAPLNHEERWNL